MKVFPNPALAKFNHFFNHTHDFLNMPPQSYLSFNDMAQQIGMSRVYAGIHTRYACDAARTQGKRLHRIFYIK